MKDILKTYKERLINLNTRNRSLFLGKVSAKGPFDLFNLNDIKPSIDNEIIKFILSSSEDGFTLIPDAYEVANKQKDIVDNIYNNGEIVAEEYEKITSEISEQFKLIIDHTVSMKSLLKEITAVEKESGSYELYIGFPFVEGRFKDEESVTRAPIVLFPVSLSIKNECTLFNKGKPIWNNVFLRAFSKFNEVDITIPDQEISFTRPEDVRGSVKEIIQSLESLGIRIRDIDSDNVEICKFTDMIREELKKENLGGLKLVNYVVLGRFTIANAIYNDYEKLEKMDINEGLVVSVFGNCNSSFESDSEWKYEDEYSEQFSENETFLFTDLDASQERAVKKASKAEKLVIYGPPGTGKSQAIANIVVDALYKKKKVLVVSQKRAALDVLYNRLAPIHPKVVLVHDAEKGKKEFQKATASILEDNKSGIAKSDILVKKGKEIDEKIEELNAIARAFDIQREFGLTIQQMYSQSKELSGRDDSRYKKVLEYLGFDDFQGIKYEDVRKAVTDLSKTSITDVYYNYQKMSEKDNEICYISKDYDEIKIFDNTNSIENIRNQLKTIDKLNADYLSYFIKKFNATKSTLNDADIDVVASEINAKNQWMLQELPKDDNPIKRFIELKKIRTQEEENRRKYYELKDNSINTLKAMNKKFEEIFEMMQGFQSIFVDEYFYTLFGQLLSVDSRESTIERLCNLADFKFLDQISHIRSVIESVPEFEKNIMKFTYNEGLTLEEFKKAIEEFKEIAILANIKKVEGEDFPNINKYKNYEAIVASVIELMKEKYNMTGVVTRAIWDQELNSINCMQLSEVKRQCKKKRNNPTLRKLVTGHVNELQTIYPCWLLSPKSASEILPLEEGLFDLIIFDEASQLFIEESLPAIFRGKRIIVAGDDKQLRPNALFSGKAGIMPDEEEDLGAEYEEESLLDLAKVKFDATHLNYHYRSVYEELINFSNYAFYAGRLQVSPNIEKEVKVPPIQRIKVDGRWDNRSNLVEAEKVVDIVENILGTRADNETIGIITFNSEQKKLIEDRLESRAKKKPDFQSRYTNELIRESNGEDVSLFVKNIETVQGDERDIIIFSVAYARNEHDKVTATFGSLSSDGGENRLNVAISRAKKSVCIVTSIEPEELNVDGSKNLGPKLLKKYLQYARAVSNNDKEGATSILLSLLDSGVATKKDDKFDSIFEIEVCDALRRKGYMVDTQVGVSGYKIDLGVYDEKTSNYVLGIECDGAAFHSSKDARERDIHRQRYLESRGWSISRIWSRNWWKNPDCEITRICSIIDSKLQISDTVTAQEPEAKRKSGIDNCEWHADVAPIKVKEYAVVPKEDRSRTLIRHKIIENNEQLELFDRIDISESRGTEEVTNSLELLLKKLGISYVDHRSKGGALWIAEIDISKEQVNVIKSKGFTISYTPNGSKATKKKPAYYIRN